MRKEVILKNLGLRVNPERRGMFDAVCFAHGIEVEHDLEAGGGVILLIDDNSSSLEVFGERLKTLLEPVNPSANMDALVRDVSILE